MTQTAFIPAIPTTPQPAQSPSSQAEIPEKGEFNTHLEKAVSRLDKKDTDDRQEKPAQPESNPETVQQAQQSSNPAVQDIPVETTGEKNSVLFLPLTDGKKIADEQPQDLLPGHPVKVSVQSEQRQNISIQNDDLFLQAAIKLPKEQGDTPFKSELPQKPQQTISTEQKLSIDLKVFSEPQTPATVPQQNTVENRGMIQLQQVVATGNELGTVSIQGSVTGISLKKTELSAPLKTAQQKSPLKSPQLRQDIHGQFLETKLNLNNHKNNDPGEQREDLAGSRNQLQAGSGGSSENSFNPVDQPGELQTFSSILQTVRPENTTAIARPITLQNGTVVYENKVMDQVVDHFRMHRTVHDSKITIKLHPAELGELKIDIAMKEGNIKAHVLAQNQHVQDIVEKNMVKLRTVLEEQGFSLSDISVSTDSDSVADFNFFDQHLSQQNDQSQETIPARQQDNFTQVLEDAVGGVGTGQYRSGVNITA